MIFLWSFEPIFYFYPGFNFTIVDWVYNWIILIEKKNNGKKSCKTALDIQKSDICIYITVHVLLKGNNFLPQNLKLVFQKDGWEHVNWNQLTKSINIYISSSSDKSEGKIGFTFLKKMIANIILKLIEKNGFFKLKKKALNFMHLINSKNLLKSNISFKSTSTSSTYTNV